MASAREEDASRVQSYQAVARAHLQHFLFKQQVGYLIHPRIPVPQQDHSGSQFKIADVGSGTGIWALDVAGTLPSSVRLDGFDTDLSGCPNERWLPPNVKFHKLNILEEIPEALQEQYDLVHLRGFVLVVQHNDASAILCNAAKLVKPGGWLQWIENDVNACAIISASDELRTTHAKALYDFSRTVVPSLAPVNSSWLKKMPELFRAHGFNNIFEETCGGQKWLLPAEQDVALWGFEEMGRKLPSEHADTANTLLAETTKEYYQSQRGIASAYKKRVIVGRKIKSV